MDGFDLIEKQAIFAEQLRLRRAIISMDDFELHDLIESNAKVVYKVHWGPDNVEVPIEGNTMAGLMIAADKAIILSGDKHHVYIEGFEWNAQDRTYELFTGS